MPMIEMSTLISLSKTRVNMDTPNNGEIFLADSKGWKEEAKAVIYDVKDQVKDINISEKLEGTNTCIYLNITTVEDLKFTVELSPQGFVVVAKDVHDTISVDISEENSDNLTYFETPYSLLHSVSPGYQEAFGKSLASQLRKISQEQNLIQEEN